MGLASAFGGDLRVLVWGEAFEQFAREFVAAAVVEAHCVTFQSLALRRDLAVGELIRTDVALREFRCAGPYTVRLEYRVERGPLTQRGPTSTYPGRLVAEASIIP